MLRTSLDPALNRQSDLGNFVAGGLNTAAFGACNDALNAVGINPDECSAAATTDAEEGTQRYRAVGPAEAADINGTGGCQLAEGNEGKYFFPI